MIRTPQDQSSNPRWGHKHRDEKARVILKTVAHFTALKLQETVWMDFGCGNGGIAAYLAPHVKHVIAIDPEPWEDWATFQQQHDNLQFLNESVEDLSCADHSADIVVCNQVYEHVPNPQYLIAQIHRVLKPGGYCYFAGPNLLFPIEPHVFWPFVHWLPRNFATSLLRLSGSKKILDAYSVDYWTLKRWLHRFEIINAVPYILKHPQRYGRNSFFWRIPSLLPTSALNTLTWISPAFVFILRKPTP